MAAFAPSSTWTPPLDVSSSSFVPNPRRCPAKRLCPKHTFPVTTNAILDQSLNRDVNSNPTSRKTPKTNAKPLWKAHSESVRSIHLRLGIDDVWEDDNSLTPLSKSTSHHQNVTSLSSSSSQTPEPLRIHHSSSSELSLDKTDLSDVVSFDGEGDDHSSVSLKMPWDTTTSENVHAISYLDRRFQVLRKRQQLLNRSYDECRRITELFSKTFYLGTSLLSIEKRKAVWAIYTWCRRTDDIVDGPRVTQRSSGLRTALFDWEQRLNAIFEGKAYDALDLAMVDAISQFPSISPKPFIEMIKGMLMDVEQDRFETFDELYLYCYRVAGTVGLMTLPIMGTSSSDSSSLSSPQDEVPLAKAVEPAVALGIGLQLTNILRDVGEDRLRGRIYLPLEDLQRFNYTEQDLFNCVLDQRYINLMKFQVARARRFFKQAKIGIQYLHKDSRFPVQASLDMYSQILDVLEENGYDNFNRRAHISKTRKLVTLPTSLLRVKESGLWTPVLKAVEFAFNTQSKL